MNPIDVRRAEGYERRLLSMMGASRFPMSLGNDFAGTIVAVGERVTAFAVLRGEPIRLGFRSSDGDNESESWAPVTDEGISVWRRGDKRRWSRDQGISSALPGA